MPKIQIKVEGTTKMIKTVLVNVNEVCQAIGRPVDCEPPFSHVIIYAWHIEQIVELKQMSGQIWSPSLDKSLALIQRLTRTTRHT